MENLFRKYKIRSFRIVLNRVIPEENGKTENDAIHKTQLKECKVVLSRFEDEEIIRKLHTVNREEHRSMRPEQQSQKKIKNARKMVPWLPQSTEYKIPFLEKMEESPAMILN